jgi:hypothetical protein
MGLAIRLIDASGRTLGEILDSERKLEGALPSENDERFPLLRFVDSYGDTVFNRLQAGHVRQEVERLQQVTGDPAVKQLMEELLQLANECAAAPHRYLKFLGD